MFLPTPVTTTPVTTSRRRSSSCSLSLIKPLTFTTSRIHRLVPWEGGGESLSTPRRDAGVIIGRGSGSVQSQGEVS